MTLNSNTQSGASWQAAERVPQTTSLSAALSRLLELARHVEGWLDRGGKPAWIAAIVVSMIACWPLGLALLGYVVFFKNRSKTMFKGKCLFESRFAVRRSSGNSAFDAYRTETLRRLEEEQDAFEAFLQRLRDAKDKQEFDAFMESRSKAVVPADAGDAETAQAK